MSRSFLKRASALSAAVLLCGGCAALATFGFGHDGVSTHCQTAIDQKICDADGTHCNVTITVAQCGTEPDVRPSTLYVCKNNTRITWHLAWASGGPTGLKFASNGIDFKGESEMEPPQFESPQPDNVTFIWKDKHTKADPNRPINYGVNILSSNGSVCYHHDPLVINE